MSTNRQLSIALSDVAPGFALAIVFEGSGEQNDAISRRLKNATRGEVMMLRQNFGGRHERDLMSALDGDNGCFECNQSLARPDVALKKASHRERLLHGGRDFFETPPLC